MKTVKNETEKFDQPGTLLKAALREIKDSKLTVFALHKKTGLPPDWLSQVKRGTIENPSVNRIQFLYERMTGKKLRV